MQFDVERFDILRAAHLCLKTIPLMQAKEHTNLYDSNVLLRLDQTELHP